MIRDLPGSFEECEREIARHSARWSGKLANNTYLRQTRDGDFEIVLHRTPIVTYYRDGSIMLDTGGWNTVTTRARMRAAGFCVGTTAGVLTVRWMGSEWAFHRTIALCPDGRVNGPLYVPRPAAEAIAEARAAKRAEKRRIRDMMRERIKAARL